MLTQEEIKDLMIPILKEKGIKYAKFAPVTARVAKAEEGIQTITADGLETENIAKKGDYIVKNQTKAGEEYVIGAEKFNTKYKFLETIDDDWALYKPIGKVWAIEVNPTLIEDLNWNLPFHFTASWDAAMVVKANDFLVCPLDYRSVYRIRTPRIFRNLPRRNHLNEFPQFKNFGSTVKST